MKEKKIKIIWICHFSDAKTRAHLKFRKISFKSIIFSILGRTVSLHRDFAVWISNAISEFEKYNDIELTIIFPHAAISGEQQEFTINGINYCCFRSEDDYINYYLKKRLLHKESDYLNNRMMVKRVIERVSPDIIHVIGAENPYYSITALDVPKNIPLVVSLQTLMSDPDFIKNYPISKNNYYYRSDLEKRILQKCDYIASPYKKFYDIIKQSINPNAIILNMTLPLAQSIDLTFSKKEYDFVYFAANINKACDYAVNAFALVCKQHHGLRLNISGRFSQHYKAQIDSLIQDLGISENVFFTGPKETHEEVLKQIKKSRFALLPLKIDLISGTIREAMACGLPVVSTITPATPELNENRESILLSEKGDFPAMAQNMLKLLEDENFASQIRENAIKTMQEKYSNQSFMENWRYAYYEILENYHTGKAFSDRLLIK